MSRAAAAALALSLAGCGAGDAGAPFIDSRTPPGLASRFLTPEGWAWGLVQAGNAPPQRYGVASPPVVPRGQVLVVTGFGESAENWFETVNDLNARGFTVWVLERAGQGGSGRTVARGGVVHAANLETDAAAIRAMLTLIIRPQAPASVTLLAQADGAVPALRAVEAGAQVGGLALSAPSLAPPAPLGDAQAAAVRIGLGSFALGAPRWRRDASDGAALRLTHDRWRGRVQHAWEIANPDLRMTVPSWGWRAAFASAGAAARRDAAHVTIPVLMLGPAGGGAPDALCAALAHCERRTLPGSRGAPHLETDAVRGPWLDAVVSFALEPGASGDHGG